MCPSCQAVLSLWPRSRYMGVRCCMRRRVAPMSEVERKINNKLLAEVHDWKATGKLSIA